MPRKPREFSADIGYHVIARGNNRDLLFHDDQDFLTFLSLLAFMKTQYSFDLFHYCLMRNHVHLLMRFPEPEAFRKVPQRLFLNYAKRYASRYRHVGHVFQDRFRALPIKNNGYLLECGRYIERNPVNTGIVMDAADYRWSSHRRYAFGESDSLLTLNPLFGGLSETEEERRRIYRDMVNVSRPYEELTAKALFGRSGWAKVAP